MCSESVARWPRWVKLSQASLEHGCIVLKLLGLSQLCNAQTLDQPLQESSQNFPLLHVWTR